MIAPHAIHLHLNAAKPFLDPLMDQGGLVNTPSGRRILHGSALLGPSLSLDYSYSFLDAVYDEFLFDPTDEAGDFSGNKLPRSPEHSFSLALGYSRSLPVAELTARVSYSWRDAFFWEADNDRPARDQKEPSLGLLDASVGFTRGPWFLSLWATNLTDELFRTHIVDFGVDPVSGRPSALADMFDRRRLLVTVSLLQGALSLLLVPFLPSALEQGQLASTEGLVAAIYLGLVPSLIAYATWTVALAHLPASRASRRPVSRWAKAAERLIQTTASTNAGSGWP